MGSGFAGELVIPGRPSGSVRSLLRKSGPWHRAKFVIFDCVNYRMRGKTLKRRMACVHESVEKACAIWGDGPCPIAAAKNVRVRSPHHIQVMLNRIKRAGGEGLVISHPDDKYGGPRRIKIRL
jgi:ATP-dependent DNA ligase